MKKAGGINWGGVAVGAVAGIASGMALTVYREKREEKTTEKARFARSLLITTDDDGELVAGAQIPDGVRVVGIQLPPGTYWGDLAPQTPKWHEVLASLGVDAASHEWFASYKKKMGQWARANGVKMLRWTLHEPGLHSALEGDRTRAFIVFRVNGPRLAKWGPEQIRGFGFVPTFWKGPGVPTEGDTLQAPEVQSTTEALMSLAQSIGRRTAVTAGTVLGLAAGAALGALMLTFLVKRAQSPKRLT